MTEIQQAILELLKPHGYKTKYPNSDRITTIISQIGTGIYNKTIYIQENQVRLWQWNHKQNNWLETTIDLCHPNSLQIIEDWAKT